jgi:competence protein ComEC
LTQTNAGASQDLRILFINVGRADSALVSSGDTHFLIDTGTSDSLPALVRALRDAGADTLEGVFLTHTHSDHIGGLEGVLRLFKVKNVYAAEITTDKKNGSNAVDERAQAAGMTVRRLRRGDGIALDPARPGAGFSVLGPVELDAGEDNNNSLVLSLTDGQFSCLFTGDMQFPEEQSLLAAGEFAPCTVLKVANHGNPDASSDEFVSAVSPKIAVISTDSSEDTDTPAPRVLDALKNAGASVYVTQDAKTGVLARVSGGEASVELYDAGPAPAAKDIRIESLDRKAELLVLRNDGREAVDLTHWWVLSERGGEMYFFPDRTVIRPGGTLSIASGKNPPAADLIWEDNNVWHDKKDDAALVYDGMGTLVCTTD